MYKIGYLFKANHSEIHYVKVDNVDLRKEYKSNFSTNLNDAIEVRNEIIAKKTIENIVSKFKKDDEYSWTPVFIKNNRVEKFINGNWLSYE